MEINLLPLLRLKLRQYNMKVSESDKLQEVTLGPIKIKDGLFMGDELAAKDIEFIISNKVTHVVNTVVHKIPNLWENFCIHYLSVGWTQKQTNIFDKKNNALNAIFNFIEEAEKKGESCLVHSVNGKSRSFTVIVAYLIKKYKWSLSKCLQFIDSRKENLQIRLNYLAQLEALETRMKKSYDLNQSWNICNSEDEKILNNTYKNSLHNSKQEPEKNFEKTNQMKRIAWNTQHQIIPYCENETKPPVERKDIVNLKPILKNYSQNRQEYQFYRLTAIKRRKDGNQSDSLDRILFQSTQKKKTKKKQKETSQKKRDKNLKESIKNDVRVRSLQIQDRSFLKDTKQIPISQKKLQHYNQVLASYHGLNGASQERLQQFLNLGESIQFNEKQTGKSRNHEHSEQNKTHSLDKQYRKMEKRTMTIKTKKIITISSSTHSQKSGGRNKKQRKSPKSNLTDKNKMFNKKN